LISFIDDAVIFYFNIWVSKIDIIIIIIKKGDEDCC